MSFRAFGDRKKGQKVKDSLNARAKHPKRSLCYTQRKEAHPMILYFIARDVVSRWHSEMHTNEKELMLQGSVIGQLFMRHQ